MKYTAKEEDVKEYYTPEEVDNLTDEQWEDERIYNAVMKSKEKWV
jgi:hypothetical protein